MKPFDPWAEWSDSDPGIKRGRAGLAAVPAVDAPGRPEAGSQLPASAPAAPEAPAAVPSRRDRIADLLQRLRNGDLAAADALRRLIG